LIISVILCDVEAKKNENNIAQTKDLCFRRRMYVLVQKKRMVELRKKQQERTCRGWY